MTHYENLKIAFAEPIDPTPTIEDVRQSSVDFALVKSGDRPLARIALAYQEEAESKWISADNAMLVIKHGHIIKTHHFKNDLLFVSETQEMPLSDLGNINGKTWQRSIDWERGEYGYQVNSVFSQESSLEAINIMGQSFETIVITETASYQSSAKYWKWDNSWQNTFWFDKTSGVLLKSSQQISPFSERFELQYISRAVRVM